MRILSQEKLGLNYDIPYEQVCLNIIKKSENSFRIYAWNSLSNSDDSCYLVAEYSTEAKARKAMEMLREAYCGAVYMKHADYEIDNIDLSQELEKKIREEMLKPHFLDVKIKNPVIECKVFRFPADDEVEV